MRDTGAVTSPRRVVIGTAAGSDEAVDALGRAARRSRDAGAEVIWLGGGIDVPTMVAVAVAEDADEVVIGPTDELAALRSGLDAAGAREVVVETLLTSHPPHGAAPPLRD